VKALISLPASTKHFFAGGAYEVLVDDAAQSTSAPSLPRSPAPLPTAPSFDKPQNPAIINPGRKWDKTMERSTFKSQQSTINNQQSAISNRQLSIINPRSTIVNHQSSINNRQSAILNHPSAISNQQSSIFNLPSHLISCPSHTQGERGVVVKTVQNMTKPAIFSAVCIPLAPASTMPEGGG